MTTGGTTPHWTWLIVIVPLVLVVAGVVLAGVALVTGLDNE